VPSPVFLVECAKSCQASAAPLRARGIWRRTTAPGRFGQSRRFIGRAVVDDRYGQAGRGTFHDSRDA
jgi:hypothetical protein